MKTVLFIFFTVNLPLKDLHIKLLRKTRRTVHETAWETALIKFCHSYNSQDAWEIERFGYKNSCLKVKLNILKELLENQFEKNGKFKAEVVNLKADSLRSDPIGRDRQGYSYWFTQDKNCNLRIYQEHLDEDSWKIVASNREEFTKLIEQLKANEIVSPLEIDITDEESSNQSTFDVNQENISENEIKTENADAGNDEVKVKNEEEECSPSKINTEKSLTDVIELSIQKKPNIKLKFSQQNGQGFVENVSEDFENNFVSEH